MWSRNEVDSEIINKVKINVRLKMRKLCYENSFSSMVYRCCLHQIINLYVKNNNKTHRWKQPGWVISLVSSGFLFFGFCSRPFLITLVQWSESLHQRTTNRRQNAERQRKVMQREKMEKSKLRVTYEEAQRRWRWKDGAVAGRQRGEAFFVELLHRMECTWFYEMYIFFNWRQLFFSYNRQIIAGGK